MSQSNSLIENDNSLDHFTHSWQPCYSGLEYSGSLLHDVVTSCELQKLAILTPPPMNKAKIKFTLNSLIRQLIILLFTFCLGWNSKFLQSSLTLHSTALQSRLLECSTRSVVYCRKISSRFLGLLYQYLQELSPSMNFFVLHSLTQGLTLFIFQPLT